jgi:hypothetical protein
MASKLIFDYPELLEKGEPLLDLTKAAKKIPTNPSRASIERWVRRGVRNVQLKTVMVGGRRYTTETAIREFLVGQQYTEPEYARTETNRGNFSQKQSDEKAKRFGLPEPLGTNRTQEEIL